MKKTFTIEVEIKDDGYFSVTRTNDGFNFHELIGILDHSIRDIISKMSEGIKPDIIKRQVIED